MTDLELTQKIVKEVMQWEWYFSWLEFKHQLDSEKGRGDEPVYPKAFYNHQTEGVSVFLNKDEDAISFDPLHNMNDAWMVVEKLRNKGYWVNIRDDIVGYRVMFGQEMRAREETCSRAICMAALATVEKLKTP